MATSSKKWDKKLQELRQDYPNIGSIDWHTLINNEPEVFYSVIGGVAKTKSKKSVSSGMKVAQIKGENYSELPFIEALNVLWGDRSYRSMANKTGLPLASIQKIRSGAMTPSFETMEKIAVAFNMDPSYFLEYRICKILSSLDAYLVANPETATSWYSKLNKGIKI